MVKSKCFYIILLLSLLIWLPVLNAEIICYYNSPVLILMLLAYFTSPTVAIINILGSGLLTYFKKVSIIIGFFLIVVNLLYLFIGKATLDFMMFIT